jgi:TolA-binding protein
MLLGGIGGGIATALWLGAFATPLSVPAPAEPAHSDGVEALAPVSAPPPPSSAPPAAAVPTPPEPALRAKAATRHGAEVKARAPERSSLAAEVAAIDRARTLFRAGRHADALDAVSQYQREFPRGVLARDADVVAIDALAGLHDHSELEQRARRFLERYPQDPHAARVRSLVRAR